MSLLVFDTSFSACSVALVTAPGPESATAAAPDPVKASCYEEMESGQATRLMPMIKDVMASAGASFDDLDGIATSNGPGTFTGIRISVAAARALALATGHPVFGFSSLALVAAKAQNTFSAAIEGAPIAATMDARRGELYVQLFSNPRQPALTPPRLLDPNVAVRLSEEPVVAAGTGAAMFCQAASALGRPVTAYLEHIQPDAAHSSNIQMHELNPLKPLYLRRPDAKPQTSGAISTVPQ